MIVVCERFRHGTRASSVELLQDDKTINKEFVVNAVAVFYAREAAEDNEFIVDVDPFSVLSEGEVELDPMALFL